MSKLGGAAFVLFSAILLQGGEIKGKVINASGGEALGRIEVLVVETGALAKTAHDGTFDVQKIAPGSYTLRLNAVGYRLLTVPFSISRADEVKEFSVTLVPDNFRRIDVVEVKGDVFQGHDSNAVNETNLSSSEIKETATVLADDPFRSIQTMPGISPTGNNEFFAQFSVMGAPFSDVGIYIDEVLVPNPFHGAMQFPQGASLSVLTSNTVEALKLMPAAYPERYGDTIGAALDVRTRDGSRTSPLFRATVGVADSELLGEGRLGSAKRGSWLASVRKSYLEYLLRNRIHDPFTDISFYDADAKVTYDLTSTQNLNFYAVDGHTNVNRSNIGAGLDPNTFKGGSNDFSLARAGWRWAVSRRLLLDNRAAYLRSPLRVRNPSNQILTNDYYGEWVGGTRLVWAWSKDQVSEGAWTLRSIRDRSYVVFFSPIQPVFTIGLTGVAIENSGSVQHASSFLDNKIHVLGSLRWDSRQDMGVHPLSPQASVSLRATSATQLQFGFGRYAQFVGSPVGCRPFGYLPETSTHYTAGVEQRMGEMTRFRITAFDRHNVSTVGVRDISTVLPSNSNCSSLEALHGSSTLQRDYSRGVQVVLQRRSANRLSGWLGYTFASARQRDFAVSLPNFPRPVGFNSSYYYPTLEDQRHSLNIFANYRLTPTVNLSGKWLYGSGFPVPSGYAQLVGNTYVPVGLNQARLGPYERLDVRASKDWAFGSRKLTLYGEVLNLTDHDNRRYISTGYLSPTQIQIHTESGLPITPTAGVSFEF